MSLTERILNAKILIIDDEPMSVRLLTQILQKSGFENITTTQDPTQAVALYEQLQPNCIILDLNMPKMSGHDVIKELQKHVTEDYLPIIVISAEEDPNAKFMALDLGAKDFLSKPYDRTEVFLRIRNLIEVRLLHTQVKNHNKILEERVTERTQELYNTQVDVIQRLARAIEYRDSETGMHVIRMSRYSHLLAQKAGLSTQESELILIASPLHDIGKIGIPDHVLQKPGKLTEQEFQIMKTHASIGEELLSGGTSDFLRVAREIAGSHHEKWDGGGYPRGLKGENIPLNGRICGLCDAFDALTTKRCYKLAWTPADAFAEIQRCAGAHFDPNLAKIFLENTQEFLEIKNKYPDPS
jgi:putative two-component system response regulator